MPSIRRAFAPLLLLSLACCAPYAAESDQLAAARKTWGSGPDSYSYNFQWRCFCGADRIRPVRVTVVSHAVTNVVLRDSGTAVPSEMWRSWYTVEQLYDLIDEAIARPADVVKVTFDDQTGFPLSFSADYERNAMDDEMGFTGVGPITAP